jgi:hypothetical protein
MQTYGKKWITGNKIISKRKRRIKMEKKIFLILVLALMSTAWAQQVAPTNETTEWRFTGDSDTQYIDRVYGIATLEYADGDGGATDTNDEFIISDGTTVPHIDGTPVSCLYFKARGSNAQGYQCRSGIDDPGNGVYQFTMIFDMFIPTGNNDGFLGIWNGNASNTNDAELFLRPITGGYYHGGGYYDSPTVPWQKGQWNRFVYVNDYTGNDAKIYVNGTLSHDFPSSPDYVYDGDPDPFWFLTDNSPGETSYGYIANFAFVNQLLTPQEASDLGGSSAGGIYAGLALTPDPLNGDDLVDTTKVLEWTIEGAWFTPKYDVYFDPNQTKVANRDLSVQVGNDQSTTSYDPSPMEFNTDYYWAVDIVWEMVNPAEDPNVFPGSVWTFKTRPETPSITSHPQDQNVVGDGSATAEFSVVALNAVSYKWYMSDFASGDPCSLVTDGGDISGATTDTLTINNVVQEDEAFYFCIAINGAGTDTSGTARLLTKRLLGYWPMDGDADDAVVDADGPIDGVVVGDPTWPTGILGSAINLDPSYPKSPTDPNRVGVDDYVILGDANDLNFRTETDFTVSLWVNTTGWEDDGAIISNKDWNSGSNTGWIISGGNENNGSWWWNYYAGSRDDYNPSAAAQPIADGGWHHLCVTHDRDGLATMYYDGVARAQINISDSTGTIDAGYPTVIGTDGALGTVWEQWFKGTIDEVKIWSDVLDSFEVAKLYTDLAGGEVCAEDIPIRYDKNGDCEINLLDFAEFVDHWLECYLVPTCLP